MTASRSTTRDVDRLLHAAAAAGLLHSYSAPPEQHPANLPVALVHAVYDVRPRCDDEAATSTERYCADVVVDRVRDDRSNLPPRNSQHTLNELVDRFDSVGLTAMEAALGSGRNFPGTDLSRAAYVLGAARELRKRGIDVLQDVHGAGRHNVAFALGNLPGDGSQVTRRLLTCTAHDDWVLADEPVVAFVQGATRAGEMSTRRVRDLVRGAAYELVVAPRDLGLRIALANPAAE